MDHSRCEHPDYKKAYDEAVKLGNDAVEDFALRISTTGYIEPVYKVALGLLYGSVSQGL
jgi:hypothetical protein